MNIKNINNYTDKIYLFVSNAYKNFFKKIFIIKIFIFFIYPMFYNKLIPLFLLYD